MKVYVLTISNLGGISGYEDYLPEVQVFHSEQNAIEGLRAWMDDAWAEEQNIEWTRVGETNAYLDLEGMIFAGITEHEV